MLFLLSNRPHRICTRRHTRK